MKRNTHMIVERDSDQCFTPAGLFVRLGLRFDLDPCSPLGGGDCVPATRKLTVEDDGLAHEWHGRVWLNPPYSNSAPWVDRFCSHSEGVALLPFAKAKWCERLWASEAAIVMVSTRFKFKKRAVPHSIFLPLFLAAFGSSCCEAIGRVGRLR